VWELLKKQFNIKINIEMERQQEDHKDFTTGQKALMAGLDQMREVVGKFDDADALMMAQWIFKKLQVHTDAQEITTFDDLRPDQALKVIKKLASTTHKRKRAKSTRHCKICHGTGHYSKTCHTRQTGEATAAIVAEEEEEEEE